MDKTELVVALPLPHSRSAMEASLMQLEEAVY
jgi:hypothetical protein